MKCEQDYTCWTVSWSDKERKNQNSSLVGRCWRVPGCNMTYLEEDSDWSTFFKPNTRLRCARMQALCVTVNFGPICVHMYGCFHPVLLFLNTSPATLLTGWFWGNLTPICRLLLGGHVATKSAPAMNWRESRVRVTAAQKPRPRQRW